MPRRFFIGALGLGTAIAGALAMAGYPAEPVLWVNMLLVGGLILTL